MKATEDLKDKAQNISTKFHKTMQDGKEKVKSTAADIQEAGEGVADDVKYRASELKHNLEHKD